MKTNGLKGICIVLGLVVILLAVTVFCMTMKLKDVNTSKECPKNEIVSGESVKEVVTSLSGAYSYIGKVDGNPVDADLEILLNNDNSFVSFTGDTDPVYMKGYYTLNGNKLMLYSYVMSNQTGGYDNYSNVIDCTYNSNDDTIVINKIISYVSKNIVGNGNVAFGDIDIEKSENDMYKAVKLTKNTNTPGLKNGKVIE